MKSMWYLFFIFFFKTSNFFPSFCLKEDDCVVNERDIKKVIIDKANDIEEEFEKGLFQNLNLLIEFLPTRWYNAYLDYYKYRLLYQFLFSILLINFELFYYKFILFKLDRIAYLNIILFLVSFYILKKIIPDAIYRKTRAFSSEYHYDRFLSSVVNSQIDTSNYCVLKETYHKAFQMATDLAARKFYEECCLLYEELDEFEYELDMLESQYLEEKLNDFEIIITFKNNVWPKKFNLTQSNFFLTRYLFYLNQFPVLELPCIEIINEDVEKNLKKKFFFHTK